MAKRKRNDGPDGLAVVDKPAGWTSHDVVAKSRGLLGTRRVGHAGTLDPAVTGVLVLGVGRVTRLLRFLTALGKSYEGELVLGSETDTLDAQGEVVATHDMSQVSDAEVLAAAQALTGDIAQVPPMVSAVKIDGVRLHDLARQGIEVPREARPVHVGRFDVAPVPDQPGVWSLEVECSAGTYVRVLAADLGHALGGGGHLGSLRRTRVGSFGLGEAVPLESLTPEGLLSPADAVRDLPRVLVGDEVRADIAHGRVLEMATLFSDGVGESGGAQGVWAVLHEDTGELLAVYEPFGDERAKPAVVLIPAAT